MYIFARLMWGMYRTLHEHQSVRSTVHTYMDVLHCTETTRKATSTEHDHSCRPPSFTFLLVQLSWHAWNVSESVPTSTPISTSLSLDPSGIDFSDHGLRRLPPMAEVLAVNNTLRLRITCFGRASFPYFTPQLSLCNVVGQRMISGDEVTVAFFD